MIFYGKTLDEALETAEKQTGKKRDEFNYEILEEKNNFFKKQVKIRIKEFKNFGKIGIKNGNIIYQPGQILPSIVPGIGVKVFLNGKRISEKVSVRELDDVIIELENNEAEKKIDIIVSKDNMEAILKVIYLPKVKYRLKDKSPDNELIIEAEEENEEYPEKITKEEIEEKIKEKKIRYGIQWNNIPNALNGGEFLIARGLEPIEPVDDTIELLFKTQDEKKPVEKEGRVDYYNIGEIECVEKGQVLAVRYEGKDGKPGYDIFGNIILPKKRKIEKILKGPGCEILDNGNRAVAVIKGMPSFTCGRICVYPVHTVNGDVDIKTGNIEFEGDVVVKGNVHEGMKIKAGNNIIIINDTDNAEINAGGNVKIGRNAISSVIKAGERQLSDIQAINYVKAYLDFIKKLELMIKDLQNSGKLPGNIKAGQIIKVLLESKFNSIKNNIKEANEFIRNNCLSEVCDVWEKCMHCYNIIENGELTDFNLLNGIAEFVEKFITSYKTSAIPADVSVSYCQNCSIYATNNVEIKGKGCYNTDIFAQNEVIFSGYPGVFRGGQIYASKGIKAGKVGSEAGVLSILKTSVDGIISANVVYQNTVLYFGDYCYRIDNACKMLKAYTQRGEIIVEKFKL